MRDRGTVIFEFCWETEKILEDNLYGILEYENPKGRYIDICVVCHKRDKNHTGKLIKLKRDLEKKYRVKLDVLYIPSSIFFEALSRMSGKLGKDAMQDQVRIYYNNSDFYQFVLRSILDPDKRPQLKVEEYRL